MTLREFAKENRDKIIDMKVNDCSPNIDFVYLSRDGILKIGRNDKHGYNDQMSFGGYKGSYMSAAEHLDYIMLMEKNGNREIIKD